MEKGIMTHVLQLLELFRNMTNITARRLLKSSYFCVMYQPTIYNRVTSGIYRIFHVLNFFHLFD